MSTPPSPPPAQGYDRPYYGGGGGGGAPQIPYVSGELVVFFLVWVVVAIVTLAAKTVHAIHFVKASVALAVAYMIARGIAKAGKVFEGR